MNFTETLEKHLNALQEKNLGKFLETVCEDKITLIMPNGSLITDYENFYNLHKGWFADEDWNIEYKILDVTEMDEVGIVLLSIDYSDLDEKGDAIQMTYYLNLIFRCFDKEWLLIQDQNTIFNK